jgi:hypothetical protein
MQVRKQVLCVQQVFYNRIRAFLSDGLNHCLLNTIRQNATFLLLFFITYSH